MKKKQVAIGAHIISWGKPHGPKGHKRIGPHWQAQITMTDQQKAKGHQQARNKGQGQTLLRRKKHAHKPTTHAAQPHRPK